MRLTAYVAPDGSSVVLVDNGDRMPPPSLDLYDEATDERVTYVVAPNLP